LGVLILDAWSYAISNTISWLIWAIFSRYYAYKYFNIKPNKNTFIHIPLALVSYPIINSINQFIHQIFSNDFFFLTLSSLIILGIFFLLLFIFKQLKIKDIRFLIEMMNYKNYVKSFKEEFKNNN
jgi:hypothetical protein